MKAPIAIALAALAPSGAAAQYAYAPAPDYYRNDTAEGTVLGGGLGASAGAIIGSSNGQSPEGALIGAGVGALTGNFLGRSKDSADRQQAAYGYAATQQANARVQAMAVTNYDLIQMTAAGLDESVIMGAIQSRGGRFDLSPSGLIQLKQNGVSDRVVLEAQQASSLPASLVPAPEPTAVIVEPRPVYYYHPAPRVHFHYGVYRGPRGRHW